MLTPSLHLGELIREHGAADWNGETFTARAQQDANWFDLSYRICAVPCEQNVIPPPYQLTITRNAGAVTTYTLAWRWDGNPADIDGFNIYRNGALVGGLGVSGDGVEQDDYVSAAGAQGFEAPASLRSDNFLIRGVRIPYWKFPRNPEQ